MQGIDTEELDMALAYLAGALPCKPRWIVLATGDGEVVSQYMGRNELDRIQSLVAATAPLSRWLTSDAAGSPARVSINVGDNGAWMLLPLDSTYYLYVAVGKVRSLDAVVQGTREGLLPLLDVLGIHA